MTYLTPRLLAAGDSAILIEFADEINDAVNDRVHALARFLRAQPRADILDLTPAYSSLLVCYDAAQIDFVVMRDFLHAALESAQTPIEIASRLIEMPACYAGEFAPDLDFVAEWSGLTPAQVIELHASVIYRVYFIGFTPGFAYLGAVPDKIAAPRLASPRTRVPAGSIGIAGKQTGIYPFEMPGGWRLIGRTDANLFDPANDPPSLLQPGDRVRFVPC